MIYPDVKKKIAADEAKGRPVLPPEQIRFKALELTPKKKVRVVFLGPPHLKTGDSNGLLFSTRARRNHYPPALERLFAEYQRDLGYRRPLHGDLRVWAERGVLLLQTSLTVHASNNDIRRLGYGTHVGWPKLTYEIIRRLSDKGGIFFVLFGREAAAFEGAIDLERNALMVLAVPSNLGKRSDLEDVLGSGLFSEIAAYLGEDKSFWKLPGT